MKRVAIGAVIGAIVYFAWGAVSWMVLPWHDSTMRRLPEEQLIMDTLKTVVSEPGFYSFPHGKTADGRMNQPEWTEKYSKGPIGAIVFSPQGQKPMPPQAFLIGFLGALGISFICMMILSLSRDRVHNIVPRALLVTMVGLVVSLAVHLPYWNWFKFPADFTKVGILDTVAGFLLMGFAQAVFVPKD